MSNILEIIKDAKGVFSSTRFCGVVCIIAGILMVFVDGFNFIDIDSTNFITVFTTGATLLGVKDISKMGKGGGNA